MVAKEEYGSIVPALQAYVLVFLGLAVLTWAVYVRRGATMVEGVTAAHESRLPTAHPLPLLRPPVRADATRPPRMPCAGRGRGARLPHQPGRHVPEGLDLGRGAHPDRPADHAARARSGDGVLEPATWDEALDLVRARLRAIQAEHGRDAVAVFGGGGLTNEKAYALGKFARVVLRHAVHRLQRPVLHVLGRRRRPTAPSASTAGWPSRWPTSGARMPCSSSARTPPRRCRPSSSTSPGARTRGGLVVVDPRASATARLTDDGAGIHLAAVPGTDLVVLLALTHVLVDEGLVDARLRRARAPPAGMPCARRSRRWWPERAEAVCGIPADDAARAARLLAAAAPVHGGRGAYVLTGRGSSSRPRAPTACRPPSTSRSPSACPAGVGSGYGPLTGQGNGQGGREHGQKSDQLPGYRMIADPAARAHVAAVWGVDPDDLPGPGVPAVELLARARHAGRAAGAARARRQPRGLGPQRLGRARAALGRLDLLVVERLRALGDRRSSPTSCCP